MNEAVKEVLAEQLLGLKDPRLGFITLTEVRTTRDLRRAEVYYTVLTDDEDAVRHTQQGLQSATPLLRRELGRQLRVRQVPELEFIHDPVPAHARQIEGLLQGLAPSSDAAEDEPAADDDADR